MSAYSIGNPLLADKENILNHSHHFKASNSSFKSFFKHSYFQLSSLGNKRIVPSFAGRDKRKNLIKTLESPVIGQPHRHRINQRNEQNEPLVHYNGPLETLDQLPEEKLAWITKETSDDKELRHPLLDYPRSIVFRKPHNRNL